MLSMISYRETDAPLSATFGMGACRIGRLAALAITHARPRTSWATDAAAQGRIVPGAAQASLAAQQSTSKHFLITTRTVGNGEGALGSHPPRKPA
ncbi:MAG: hypothetical protein ACLPN6_31020 [Streptosporangiaceae bacterium]|jgi:hypothetical protein